MEFDHQLLLQLQMNQNKKVSTKAGVTRPPFVLQDGKIARNAANGMHDKSSNHRLYAATAFLFREIELQFHHLHERLFDGAGDTEWTSLTYRFLETTDEGLHLDTYNGGDPWEMPSNSRLVKYFLNVSTPNHEFGTLGRPSLIFFG